MNVGFESRNFFLRRIADILLSQKQRLREAEFGVASAHLRYLVRIEKRAACAVVEREEHVIPMVRILRILVEFPIHKKLAPDLQQLGYVLDTEKVNVRPATVIVKLQTLLTSASKRQRQQSLILDALLLFQRNVI